MHFSKAAIATSILAVSFPAATSVQDGVLPGKGTDGIALRVLTASGVEADGAEYTIKIWPDEAAMQQMEPVGGGALSGSAADLQSSVQVAAQGSVAGNGEVRVASSALRNMPSESGNYDVSIIVEGKDGQGVSFHETTLKWDAERQALAYLDTEPGTDNHVRLDESTGSVVPVTSASSSSPQSLPAGSGALRSEVAARQGALNFDMKLDDTDLAATGEDALFTQGRGCTTRKVATYRDVSTVVGEAWSWRVGGATSRMEFENGASSKMELSFKAPGGSFSSGGHVSRSISSTTSWGEMRGLKKRLLRTNFEFGKFHHYSCKYGTYIGASVKAVAQQGGATYTLGKIPYAPYCENYVAGTGGTMNRRNATYWTNGADVSRYLGLDLGVRTGWSGREYYRTDFTKNRSLCGVDRDPANDPRTWVVASWH